MPAFEDLKVFQRAVDLCEEIYRHTESFPNREIYGLTSQIRRASLSVVSHLGEGEGRLTVGEWRQFLSQARGSLFEVHAQLIVAQRLHFLSEVEFIALRKTATEVAQLLGGLIRYVRRREQAHKTSDKTRATT
jgi:four helix bundle protein